MAEDRGCASAVNTDSMGKLTAKIFRPKTKRKVPLDVISVNESVHRTRSKQQQRSISGPSEGKENTPVRSSRERTHNDEDEQQRETSRSSKENQPRLTLQKRGRSTGPSSLSGLRGDGHGLGGEDSIVGSQTSTPVCKEEGFLPDNNKTVKNFQSKRTTGACSSEDGKQSEAPVVKAVERQPDCPECYEERWPVGCCSLKENMVPTEMAGVAGTKTLVVNTVSAEESEERLSSGKGRAPAKTCRRRASREGVTPGVPNLPEQPSGRDPEDIKSGVFCKPSDELQETTARATEKMRTSSESQQRLTRQKRVRLPDLSSLPGLCGDGEGSRGEDSVPGRKSIVPICVRKEDFSLDNNQMVKTDQITGIADASSPSSAELVACGSQTPVVLAMQSSAEESGEKLSSGKKTAQTKTYRRRKSRTNSVPNPPEQRSSRDQDGNKLAEFCKSDEFQSTVGGATDTLQDAYNKLYKKYQNLKTRQLAEAAEAFDEQSRRIEVFSTAADDLVQNLRTSNSICDEEMINRSRAMEAAYIECQNDLVIERARNLELGQHLENVELRGSKLLNDLLEHTTQLTISNHGKSDIMFSHNQSGYEFKLEQNKLSEEIGGANALLYNVVSPGTILHVAPEWMQSEIVFDMTQALVFFRRMAVALRGGASV